MYLHCNLKLVVIIRGYYEASLKPFAFFELDRETFIFWLELFVCVVVSGACKIAPLSCFSHSGKNSDQSNIIETSMSFINTCKAALFNCRRSKYLIFASIISSDPFIRFKSTQSLVHLPYILF